MFVNVLGAGADNTKPAAEFSERRAALDRADNATVDQIATIGKLLQKPTQSYTSAKSEEKKRFLVKSLVGKLSYDGKKITIHWLKQYEVIAKRPKNDLGRAAGNRTQSICSQSRRTTGILQPDVLRRFFS